MTESSQDNWPLDFEVDDAPYPTDESLEAVRKLDAVKHGREFFLTELPRIAEMLQPYAVCEVSQVDGLLGPEIEVRFSTQGWSGCEDLIDAMQDNIALWAFYWFQSTRGGHYRFRMPVKEPR